METTNTTTTTTSATTATDNNNNGANDDGSSPTAWDLWSRTAPPSHVLSDGRFIQLPAPDDGERSLFFARTVARHGLVSANADADKDDKKEEGEKEEKDDEKEKSEKKQEGAYVSKSDDDKKKPEEEDDANRIHPLVVASARIVAGGIAELSKAINLGGLASSGEYFGLSNIVSASAAAEAAAISAAAAAATAAAKAKDAAASEAASGAAASAASSAPAAAGGGAAGGAAAAGGAGGDGTSGGGPNDPIFKDTTTAEEMEQDRRRRSAFSLKRKRAQFRQASRVLRRHVSRLDLATTAQRVVDRRLWQLRQRWRLAAPEHGTRVVGPVRPSEVVAMDVEVYDRDRTGGASSWEQQQHQAAAGGAGGGKNVYGGGDITSTSYFSDSGTGQRLGRIARMVPRYATIELSQDYALLDDFVASRKRQKTSAKKENVDADEKMDVEPAVKKEPGNEQDEENPNDKDSHSKSTTTTDTRAEPFAVADPTLGKVDPDFDPDKVPMLTLLLQIEKASTNYVESVTLSSATSDQSDEGVVLALQHSLFCASLFESMRSEIAGGSGGGGDGSTAGGSSGSGVDNTSTAWLSSEMEESFLPPPSLMVMGGGGGDDQHDAFSLCVVHCHQGEVKVQLDSEYALTMKLVEAATHRKPDSHAKNATTTTTTAAASSGSQTPAFLRALCRALLLHAQFVYHDFSSKTHEPLDASELEQLPKATKGHAVVRREPPPPSPHILQSIVALGSKMLMEQKVRWTLQKIIHWLSQRKDNGTANQQSQGLDVEWMPLSMFDSHSHVTVGLAHMSLDVDIHGDGIRVTSFGAGSDLYRSVHFGSPQELEFFLKLQMRRPPSGSSRRRSSLLGSTNAAASTMSVQAPTAALLGAS